MIELSTVELAERISGRHPLTVGIIGQGVVGSMAARIIAGAGIDVAGYDTNRTRIRELRAARDRLKRWTVSDRATSLSNADILILAVRARISRSGSIDRSTLRQVAAMIGGLPGRERLVIIESTVPPGITRWFAEQLSRRQGREWHIAYCPERLRAGQLPGDVVRIPRLVGGVTPSASEMTARFLARLGVAPVVVPSPEVAELSKLLENVFLSTGISLMGEVTRIAHALGINANEVALAAATKPDGYLPFWPGAGIGGHCLPSDLKLLRRAGTKLAVKIPLLNALEQSAGELSRGVVHRLAGLLSQRGRSLAGARVWIIGVGFKAGSSDTTATPANEIVRLLRARRASVVYSDALVGKFAVGGTPVRRVPPEASPCKYDAALLLSGDRTISLSQVSTCVPLVLDAGGGRLMDGMRDGIVVL